MKTLSSLTLVGFVMTLGVASANSSELDWMIVNDSVMGGVSTSQIVFENEQLIFSGNLSLENNGGFASARTLLDLSSRQALNRITLCFEGDGRTYKLRFRTNRAFDGLAYSADFKTKKNTASCVSFEAVQFAATFRGRLITNAPQFSFQDVRQMGLMIADKKNGPFQLKVMSINFD